MRRRLREADEGLNEFVAKMRNELAPLVALFPRWADVDFMNSLSLELSYFIKSYGLAVPSRHLVVVHTIEAIGSLFHGDERTFENLIKEIAGVLGTLSTAQYVEFIEEFVYMQSALIKKMLERPPEYGDMPDPPYGNYIFALRRKAMPPEGDTREEDHVYNQLYGHVNDNTPMSSDSVESLMGVLDAGAYKEIIHEPTEQMIYRGVSFSRETLAKIIDGDPTPEGSKVIDKIMRGGRGTEGSTSWSTNKRAAAKFSISYPARRYSCLLVARRSDNPDAFIEGPGGFYDVQGLSTHRAEWETIGLGPIRVHKIYWQKTDPADGEGSDTIDWRVVQEGTELLRRAIRELVLTHRYTRRRM